MFIAGVEARALGTNCWVVATDKGGVPGHASRRECVIIDPGVGVADAVEQVCEDNRLHPVAVLLTHGHLDHTFSVVPVCGARDVPAYIHTDDRALLLDPWRALAASRDTPLFGAWEFSEPDDVRELSDGQTLEVAGLDADLTLAARSAPGHTPGSVAFSCVGDDAPVLFTGDLLFAGAIGRTDLPGGDGAAMMDSLRRVVLGADDNTVVHPGHGPSTTIEVERHSNPFLRLAASGAGRVSGAGHGSL